VTVYKIQNSQGLFSRGGLYRPRFDKKGKIWRKLGGLVCHLMNQSAPIPEDWVVIEYELMEPIEGGRIKALDFIKERVEKKNRKEEERKQAQERYRQSEEYQ
jgi:hypothetical protein